MTADNAPIRYISADDYCFDCECWVEKWVPQDDKRHKGHRRLSDKYPDKKDEDQCQP